MNTPIRTLYVGKEYDANLLRRLHEVLKKMGGVPIADQSFVVGSQDYWIKKIKIDGQVIEIESETYVGVSITGPDTLVEAVGQALQN